jgi:hypothetical protein
MAGEIKPLRKCRHCGLEAYTEEDLKFFREKSEGLYSRDNLCKKCYMDYHKDYYQKHKKDPSFIAKRKFWRNSWYRRNKEKMLLYHREHRISYSGRRYWLRKRPWTGFCELCGKKADKNLHYHHWDEKHKEKGIWVCGRCHRWCHGYDHLELLDKYLQLKKEINEKWASELSAYSAETRMG